MTSKDKTGDQLVASIRKSKSGTVASKTAERPDTDESAAKSTTRRRATTAKAPSTVATDKSATAETNQDGNNSFSHGHRVWPD